MSPKSNGQVVLIRNSERGSFKRCRQAWYWNFVDLLKPVETGKALRFGDLIHQALAAYYKKGKKRGPLPHKTFLRLYEETVEELGRMNMRADDDEKWVDAAEMGEAMLKGYVDAYGERDKDFTILSSEQTFQVPLTIRSEVLGSKPFRINVVGTLDGVWQHLSGRESPFFKEFKTAAQVHVEDLAFDEQAGTYWTYAPKWLWKHKMIPEGIYPDHILYTFLRKALPDARPRNEAGNYLNQDGTISKKQPPPYFVRQPVYRDEADRVNMHERVIAEAVEMELTRRGVLKPIKNPGPLFMPNCRFCGYKDMCELHETGNDWEAMRDGTMVKWDPYDAHEIIERW